MKKKINAFWLALSVLLSAAALALCLIAGRGGSLYLQPDGDPGELVSYFFNAIVAGEYRSAYACLSDYSELGLEHLPESGSGRMLYEALQRSYGFSLSEECRVDKLTAVQPVLFRYLDVKAVEAQIAARVGDIAADLVEERPAPEIYDEDGYYLASFTDEVYATALDEVLRDETDYYNTVPLEIELSYSGGAWRIHSSPALFSALLGGL